MVIEDVETSAVVAVAMVETLAVAEEEEGSRAVIEDEGVVVVFGVEVIVAVAAIAATVEEVAAAVTEVDPFVVDVVVLLRGLRCLSKYSYGHQLLASN